MSFVAVSADQVVPASEPALDDLPLQISERIVHGLLFSASSICNASCCAKDSPPASARAAVGWVYLFAVAGHFWRARGGNSRKRIPNDGDQRCEVMGDRDSEMMPTTIPTVRP